MIAYMTIHLKKKYDKRVIPVSTFGEKGKIKISFRSVST